MKDPIENPRKLPLEPNQRRVLKTMFSTYDRLVLRSRFTSGLSGSYVYMVRPIMKDGAELPSVVKIDRHERIEQEWQAYKSCVQNRLPKVAAIRGEPVNPPGCPLSGLWYPLAGGGIDEVISLEEFLSESPPDKIGSFLENRLFKYFTVWWQQARLYFDFNFGAAYNEFLPINVVIHCTEAKGESRFLHPETMSDKEWEIGDYVQVSGFKVVKLLPDKQGLSLDSPDSKNAFRLHVYGIGDVSEYEVDQVISRPFTGLITENRQRQLLQQAQQAVGLEMDLRTDMLTLPDGRTLPNPLEHWQMIFADSMDVKVACIHGDLNMENILVDRDSETIHLIDFAKARKDHVLRDLLHLEMAVVNKIMSKTMKKDQIASVLINDLYQRLHCVVIQGIDVTPPAGQEKVFAILQSIRGAAQPHMVPTNGWKEYYTGLFIYLLGSLRFGDLDKITVAPRPKQLAFWGAATILDLMENEPECTQLSENEAGSKTNKASSKTKKEPDQKPGSGWDVDRIVTAWQANALPQRLTLFNILKAEFSIHELNQELAFSLGMDLDDLPSSGKSGKAQELIGYFERRGRIRELIEAVARIRPNADWE